MDASDQHETPCKPDEHEMRAVYRSEEERLRNEPKFRRCTRCGLELDVWD